MFHSASRFKHIEGGVNMNDVMKNFKKHLLNGVSYMIPVVLIGGVVMGLGITLGGNIGVPAEGTLAFFLFILGKTGINLMPAVIAGYIAFSISDKIALAPAFICGQLSQDVGAGFFGGIVAGYLVDTNPTISLFFWHEIMPSRVQESLSC
jgi:fructose-specific PTS system IIC-like component